MFKEINAKFKNLIRRWEVLSHIFLENQTEILEI